MKKRKRKIKKTCKAEIKDHLRGFTRTIPSFIMAYSDCYNHDKMTLKNFERYIPNYVFSYITCIAVEDFLLLIDGGDTIDKNTGEKKYYSGNIFDEIVFNSSIEKFLEVKQQLSNYFDESLDKNIFDYIPNPKTNKVYTPKNVVISMVNMLEDENPDCFNNPENTFADLYVKSGLYISEIVKRLYNSPKLIELYPNPNRRLKHIFEKQVYGLCPSDMFYNISVGFLLGFDTDKQIKHNIKICDVIPYTQSGTLEEKLDELFYSN